MNFYNELALTKLLVLFELSFFLHKHSEQALDLSLYSFNLQGFYLATITLLDVYKVQICDGGQR
jgi:hypothetical protein